jgi:DNA-directed RNA polymerase subunit N (RpoN/RPB10)
MELQFARILNPVCSCGNYIGRFQHLIEFKLLEMQQKLLISEGRKTDDRDVAKILDEMDIKRMCCRREVIVSPVLRLLKVGETFNIYQDKTVLSEPFDRLIVRNKNGPDSSVFE